MTDPRSDPLQLPETGDESDTIRRRNRNNRGRGTGFEQYVAEAYRQAGHETRRTGPLLGKDDVVIGDLFVAQTKKEKRPLSLNQAHAYIDALAKRFPRHVPIVVHAYPGDNRGAIVIWRLSDHVAMHGKDGLEDKAA